MFTKERITEWLPAVAQSRALSSGGAAVFVLARLAALQTLEGPMPSDRQ